jgi:dTMP kinase
VTGRFVVLEGGDGSGKSTQLAFLVEHLRSAGVDVVVTREPGGTALGEAIRALVLDGGTVDARAEALLMAADRAQHVAEVVRPALAAERWVVSDRHVPSSLVYQGVVRKLGVEAVDAISRFATDGMEPDLVVLLDVDDATAESRRSGDADRLEREGAGFHAAVRAAYRDLASGRAWVVVDASGSPEEVAAAVRTAVAPLLTRITGP